MKALIKVGYGCNDHCAFCHTLDVRHVDAEAREVHLKIRRAKELGHQMVVLSGGEPTIRPELLAWASHVAKLDMDFGLVTNGRMLSYPALVDKLMERRLRYVYLSLHGGTPKVHNLMVRSEAFEQTYGAIEVLSGRDLDFTANCVITKHNVEHLRGLVDAVLPYPDVTLKFSMVEPKGGGDKLFTHLMPRVSHVAEKVRDAITYARESRPDDAHRVTHGAIPLCLMEGFEDAFDDLKTHRFGTMIEVGEPDFFPVDDLNKVQPESPCRGCSLSGPCPGLYRGYEEVFGSGELTAVRDRPRSNSFNYVFESVVTNDALERCPIREGGVSPWEMGRHLFVRDGGTVGRYFAASRDFSDAEIRATKHGLGQLYLDVSTADKPAPDDFTRELRPLERSALCIGCPERPGCTGMFDLKREEDPFTRDDAHVRAVIEELEGEVVDLGAGAGRYGDVFETKIERGELAYTAIDPDAAALDKRSHGGARVAQTAEDWARKVAPASVDHVLILRSWNHFAEPAVVIAAASEALSDGGTLTVVDDTAFGLARTKDKAQRAETSDARFEHFRNDTAADAERVIRRPELELVQRRNVSAETSTLWLLRYRKLRTLELKPG